MGVLKTFVKRVTKARVPIHGQIKVRNLKFARNLIFATSKTLVNFMKKIENFNYLNVAFISYKLTMWDLMLFAGCHTRANVLEKKTVLVSRRIYW